MIIEQNRSPCTFLKGVGCPLLTTVGRTVCCLCTRREHSSQPLEQSGRSDSSTRSSDGGQKRACPKTTFL